MFMSFFLYVFPFVCECVRVCLSECMWVCIHGFLHAFLYAFLSVVYLSVCLSSCLSVRSSVCLCTIQSYIHYFTVAVWGRDCLLVVLRKGRVQDKEQDNRASVETGTGNSFQAEDLGTLLVRVSRTGPLKGYYWVLFKKEYV